MRNPTDTDWIWLSVLAIVVVILGIWGFLDASRWGRGGFVYSPEYIVEAVDPGGGADEAGLQVGDLVVAVDGIPVEDLPLYSRWPRDLAPRPGESLPMVVERGADTLRIEVVYGSPPESNTGLRLGAGLIGLVFMLSGLWALFTTGTPQAWVLAWLGMAAGAATLGKGPYFGTWDGLSMHIQLLATVLWSLLLFWFFLVYPKPKKAAESRWVRGLLFAPWLLLIPLLVLELILHPALYHSFGWPAALLITAYLMLALVAVMHTVATTPRMGLRDEGMGRILAGFLIALVPNLVVVAGWTLVPGLSIPGARLFPLLIAAIPVSMALAVRKQGAASAP